MARKAKPGPVRVAIIARTKDEGENYAAIRGVAVEDALILTIRTKDAARGQRVGRILVTPGMRTDPNRGALMAAARLATDTGAQPPAPVPASPRPLSTPAPVADDEDDADDATLLDFDEDDED